MGLVGKPVKRIDGPKYVSGKAQYVADLKFADMVEIAFVRSRYGHARLRHVDVSEAIKHPYTIDIVTAKDIHEAIRPVSAKVDREGFKSTEVYPLARDKVLYVGEPIAAVVAKDRYVAEDIAEMINVDYEPLTALVYAEEALKDGAPLLHEDLGTNTLVHRLFENGDIETALQDADHIIKEHFRIERHTGATMETRGYVACYEKGSGRLTLYSSGQLPHFLRMGLSEFLRIGEHRIRVIMPDVGGGYGTKGILYPEEVLCCHLSMKLGRPVRWIEDRIEHFQSATHGWEQDHYIEVGVKKDGTILGVRNTIYVNVGAYSVYPVTAGIEPLQAGGLLPGPYKFQDYFCDTYGVATNKSPTAPYRGIARPCITFVMEGMIDRIARAVNMDPAEVRLKNMIQPEDFPYRSPTRLVHDRASYTESVKKALESAGYKEWREKQKRLREEGRYIGLGIGSYSELTGLGSGTSISPGVDYLRAGNDAVRITITPTGMIVVYIGMPSQGQGLETAITQIVADEMEIPPENIAIINNDSELTPFNLGTMASRGAVIGGVATIQGLKKLKDKMLRIAAHFMDVNIEDLEYGESGVRSKHNPAMMFTLPQLAGLAYFAVHKLPPDLTPGLEVTQYYDPKFGTFANGTHLAVVEIDPEIGSVTLLDYTIVDDCGTILNPMLVDGQLKGGAAQGISGALLEKLVYDNNGQLLTGTFMDYLLITARDLPQFRIVHLVTPSERVMTGVKGVGEGATVGSPAAVINAINDALVPMGAQVNTFPTGPQEIFQKIRETKNP
ncbi:MAG: xanthine dehydrogenase family protein molybdopterin-binding subunit [Pseudomonadota bacterium]